jgi:hypothetical protein
VIVSDCISVEQVWVVALCGKDKAVCTSLNLNIKSVSVYSYYRQIGFSPSFTYLS